MPERPKFALFVRSVAGRVATYYPTGTYIGARRATPKELEAGEQPIIWDTERITPISEEDYSRYRREFDDAFRFGDLVRCTEEQWRASCELEAERAAQETAELEAQSKRRDARATAPSSTSEGTELNREEA